MSEELQETAELLTRAHEWIDSLLVAGMTERAAVTALMTAATERSLRAGGAESTAAWLDGQAERVRRFGPDWLRTLEA